MLKPGLVSISFRKVSAEDLIKVCADCGLEVIEWGGDVHVPHGDAARARQVRELMDRSGLSAAAYGSYYRVGEENQPDFAGVVECAKILGASTVRVWAGAKASVDADPAYRAGVAADLKRIAGIAAASGLTVSTEYHCNTLTDEIDSARELLDAVPEAKTLWQPPNGKSFEHRMKSFESVADRVTNVHVFHWIENTTRRPLAEGAADWKKYLAYARQLGGDRAVCLEFAMNDSLDQLKEDAATLLRLLKEI